MSKRIVPPAWRELAGVIVKDLPRYVHAMARRNAYLRLCNRGDRLEPTPEGEGVRCLWQWSSDLHAPKRLPSLGRWLMRRALDEHPVRRASAPAPTDAPQVAFVIGHRGEARLPLLLATIESIAAQEGGAVECIVVQQETEATLAGRLPTWVRLVHTPPDDRQLPFCRSWALNVGARHARAPILVLHDNDMLASVDYVSEIIRHVARGYEVVNLKRFVFYVSEEESPRAIEGVAGLRSCTPEAVVQNLEGGGSVAITREAFERIGGMDESFVGWGGEDSEFWERAALLKVWSWTSLPLVHLWHPAQPRKQDPANPTAQHYRTLSAVPPQQRIETLRARVRGQSGGPVTAAGTNTEDRDCVVTT